MVEEDDFIPNLYAQNLDNAYPIAWNHTLRGNNTIFGIGSSGLDLHHCMFGREDNSDIHLNVIDESERKVRAYYAYTNKNDNTFGFGSHTAGLIAGMGFLENLTDPYNGLSTLSKLVVLDVCDDEEGLEYTIPEDLYYDYYSVMYK